MNNIYENRVKLINEINEGLWGDDFIYNTKKECFEILIEGTWIPISGVETFIDLLN